MFDDLLSMSLITLFEMKRSGEVRNTDEPNYCKYHYLVGHSIQKRFVFKDKVMDLARQEKILVEEDKTSVNQISINSLQSMKIEKLEKVTIPVLSTIYFGSFDPI